jgi:hypothetical protein
MNGSQSVARCGQCTLSLALAQLCFLVVATALLAGDPIASL